MERAADLDSAQEAKLDLVCRKLRLRPGMRVLDIGSGWGSFALFAAQEYGVRVVGITVSKEQLRCAARRTGGLPVEFRLQDYRDLSERFDAVVSIGMPEHVGMKNYEPESGVIERCEDLQGAASEELRRGTWLSAKATWVIVLAAMGKGPRNLRIKFGTASLTHYGGAYLIHRFLSRIGFKDAVAQQIRFAQRNNRYTSGEMVLALLYPMILGLERIETAQLLRQNGVFQFLTGLPSYPEATTLRRFLLRAAPAALPKLRRLHDRLLRHMSVRPHPPRRLIFDLDSTVLVLYGKQEEARPGYNPIKPGRPSYHPLLCFEGESRDFWHGELRPGDAFTASGTVELLTACFAKMPPGIRNVIIRADKGFYDHTRVEWLEEQGASFVIAARLTAPIKRKLPHLRYLTASPGVEAAEFQYQPTRWRHPYRFVVIRRPQPDEITEQLSLFKLGKYHYQALVTNMALLPLNLWRFYNDRAAVELIIKQLKGDYALGSIPTRHLFANETYFHLLLLAYNLINWFKRLCLPSDFQNATLQTLRHKILLMPAQLRRAGNRPSLALPTSGYREQAWKFALAKIEALTP